MKESSWVRSAYLYVMCMISLGLVLYGLGSVAVGIVHTVSPDLGHRDTLDRVGIGLTNVADGVVEIIDEGQRESIEQFCEDFADSDDDFDECVEQELEFAGGAPFGIGQITEGVGEVRDELESQIRNSSIDRMIRGVVMVLAGIMLWRVHAARTAVFRDGLMPARREQPAVPTEVQLQSLPTPLPASPPAAPPPSASPPAPT